jgi:hypothetical protein
MPCAGPMRADRFAVTEKSGRRRGQRDQIPFRHYLFRVLPTVSGVLPAGAIEDDVGVWTASDSSNFGRRRGNADRGKGAGKARTAWRGAGRRGLDRDRHRCVPLRHEPTPRRSHGPGLVMFGAGSGCVIAPVSWPVIHTRNSSEANVAAYVGATLLSAILTSRLSGGAVDHVADGLSRAPTPGCAWWR